MTLDEMRRLWPLAKLLHEARRDLAWGSSAGARREPWPEWHRAYPHSPISYVDLALAQAEAVERAYEMHATLPHHRLHDYAAGRDLGADPDRTDAEIDALLKRPQGVLVEADYAPIEARIMQQERHLHTCWDVRNSGNRSHECFCARNAPDSVKVTYATYLEGLKK